MVFGRVISGQEVVKAIEETPVDKKARPLKEVLVADCGLLSDEAVTDSDGEEREERQRHRKEKKHKKKIKKQKKESVFLR